MKIIVAVYMALALTLGIGWVTNIVKFVNLDFEPSYKAEIIRGLGIVMPPVGGICGYMDIADGQPSNESE